MPFKERSQIKYLTTTYKKANENGILSPFLFWCFCKTACNGSIDKKEFVSVVSSRININRSLITRYKKKCLELGFIYEKDEKIFLASYQKLWELFDMKISPPNEKGNILWSDNKILKIGIKHAKTFNQLKHIIISQETAYNTFLQCKIGENKSKKEDKNDDSTGSNAKPLSCKKISNNFGYKSLMTGSRLRQKLDKSESFNLIKSTIVIIARGVKFADFKFYLCKDNSYHWFKGKVYKKLCDLILFVKMPYHKEIAFIKSIK